jgi:DNA-binding response OmpR family regulator
MREEPIRILLIEDNPRDAGLVKEMLAETNTVRFELTHSDRLLKALEILGKDRVDIILLDLSLPDGHGLDTVIQTNTAKPEIPIVIMSGMGDEDLIKALHEGAQDYSLRARQIVTC